MRATPRYFSAILAVVSFAWNDLDSGLWENEIGCASEIGGIYC